MTGIWTRAVYCASFFDTIRYNTFSCDIRYIWWTICLNIFSEKEKKNVREQTWHTCNLKISSYAWGIWMTWWQMVMDSDICFPTGSCNLLEHKLHLAALVLFICWILSKFVRFLLEAIFEFWTLSQTIKSAIFKPDVILAYRQNNVSYIAWQTYTGMYRYIDTLSHP